ncbi:MAG: glycosyltransferase [Magnetococcus sp. MYC-9]
METTPRLLDVIERLDATDDTAAFIQFVQNGAHDPNDLVFAVYHLLTRLRFRSAYILASFLTERGIQNPFLSIALCIGALIIHNPAHETYGLEHLAAQADQLLAEQPAIHAHIHAEIMDPAMRHLLAIAIAHSDQTRILQLLEILKAFVPRFRGIFDWNAPVPEFSLADMQHRGRQQAPRLIRYPSPPAGRPQPRRVTVVLREFIFPDKSWSRPFDVGPRIVAAMNRYGWQTVFYPLKGNDLVAEALEIVALCRQQQTELLVLDDDILIKAMPLRSDLIARLRQALPALKIVGFLADAWEPEADLLRESASLIERIWSLDAPSRPLWEEPELAPKMLHLPIPFQTGNYRTPQTPLSGQAHFSGSISGFNWHRAFWVPAFERARLPIKVAIASHQTDGLSALESYSVYMRTLAEATCCISLAMRPNHHCIVTSRSFETIHSGSLLIQETSEDMYRYFIPGEHYLEFSTLPELAAVLRFVQEHPAEAEAIRRRGNAFIWEWYGDEKLIGYLDQALFSPA